MKIINKDLLFQIVLLTVVAVIWDIWALRQSNVETGLARSISEQPYLCSAESLATLNRAAILLKDQTFIGKTEIESGDSLKARMFREIEADSKAYLSEETKTALDDTHVPHILYIHLKGEEFGVKEFSRLKEVLAEAGKVDSVKTYQKWGGDNLTRLDTFRSSSFVYHFVIALCWTVLAVLMRAYFERQDQRYWNVIARSGGDVRRKSRVFQLRTLWLGSCTVGASFIAALIYAAILGHYVTLRFSLPLIQAGLLVLSTAIVMIFLRRESR